MRTDGNLGATTTYHPNGQGLWDNQPEYTEPPLPLEGDAGHYDHRLEDDHWEQPGNLFRKMTSEQKQLLFDNTARAINGVSQEVLDRHIANLRLSIVHKSGLAITLQALTERSTVAGRLRCEFRSENIPEKNLVPSSNPFFLFVENVSLNRDDRLDALLSSFLRDEHFKRVHDDRIDSLLAA